jgi:serine/threonine protein kinase
MLDEITPTLQPGDGSTRIMALRAAWEKGEFSDLAGPIGAAQSPKQAADLVISEQYYRWKHGDRRRVESYLQSFPSLRHDPASLLEMLRAEIVLRREYQEKPEVSEYDSSFPEVSRELHQLLQSHPEKTDIDATLGIAESEIWRPHGKSVALDAPRIQGYELKEELGRGGMGVVFRAKQLLADREVALKIIRPDSLALLDPTSRDAVIRRFGAEARAAAKLNNDHIVTVYDIGECRGFHFYTMKLVEGPSLSNLLREKPLEDRLAARYCMEASLGVHAAHELGILHRDLKPSNVMLDRMSGRALVADFGLAKIANEGREQLTHSGDVVGTPAYMPPEQAKDSSTVTAQSDVYSLGATLYHAITGRPPFQAASLGEILRQIADEEPIAPRRMNKRINRDLETICLKAMQKSPAQRYATAKDFADDLKRYLEGRPILARPISRPEVIWRWCKRNPALANAIGAATTLAILAIVSIVIGYIQTNLALAASKRQLEKSLSLVDELFTRVSEDDLLNEPGMQVVRKQLLERARAHYQELLKDSKDLPFAREELAAAHYRFGKISLELGDAEVARRELAIAEREQRAQLTEEPNNEHRVISLSETLIESAKLKQLDEKYDALLAIYSETLKLRNSVAAKHPENMEYQRKAASAQMNLGAILKSTGDFGGSQREMTAAQNVRVAILQKDQSNLKARQDLAKGAYNLGNLYLDLAATTAAAANRKKAEAQFAIAIESFESLTQSQPRVFAHRLNLAKSLRLLASVSSDPIKHYERAVNLLEDLIHDNPDVIDYRLESGRVQLDFGDFLLTQGNWEKSDRIFGNCGLVLQPLIMKNADAAETFAISLQLRAAAQEELGEVKTAIETLKLAETWWIALQKQLSNSPDLEAALSATRSDLRRLQATTAGPAKK